METIYFQKRSELTEKMRVALESGFTCYRIRVMCNCGKYGFKDTLMYPTAHMRNGVLVTQDERIVAKYIRCRKCSGNNQS